MELKIPGYEVFDSIGSGGMANVYRARHIRLDREVALKVMLSRYATDDSFGERFIREARIAANLIHPHIVQIYDINCYEGTSFLAMEFVRDGDLSQRLHKTKDKEDIAAIIRDLSLALDYAHERGYIHRDIKPANILFRENGSLVLSDFGIARAIHSDTHMTQTGMVVGTPSYMSPEQAKGNPLTGSSDLYSVAVIAYQLVAGKLPYRAESSISVAIKHITDPIPKLPKGLAGLQPFFDIALAKDPKQRFKNGQALASAFAKSLGPIDTVIDCGDEDETILSGDSGDADRGLSHSDFKAFSLDNHHISELETETLSSFTNDHQKPIRTEKEPKNKALPSKEKNLPISVQQATTRMLQVVFIQINRIKVLIFPPDKRPVLLLSLALLLGFSVVAVVLMNNPFKSDEVELSPGQKIRLGQLIVSADKDMKNGRLIEPLGENAHEKYLAILAISPADAVAIEGIYNIVSLLVVQVTQHIQMGDLTRAEYLLKKLDQIQPSSPSHQPLVASLVDAKKHKQQALEKKISEAVAANQSGQAEEAIRLYSAALAMSDKSVEARIALRDIANFQSNKAEAYSAKKDFSSAKQALDIAKSASSPLSDDTLTQALERTGRSIERQEKNALFNERLRSALNKADSALSLGQLSRPKNGSAHYYYTQALKMSPSNKRANRGLESTHNELVKIAERYLEKRDEGGAETAILSLSSVNSSHRDLFGLKKRLGRVRANNRKIQKLYSRAAIYLSNGKAKHADKMHAKIKQIYTAEPNLDRLGKKIADGYVGLAQREIDAKDWEDVDVWVSRGLKHVPRHKKLLEMRAYAKTRMR